MSQYLCTRAFRAGSPRRLALLALTTLALAGCGSTSVSKSASHPSTSATQPLAATPAHRSTTRIKPARRGRTARGIVTGNPGSVASAPCPAGEKRTATGLCYSPAAQTKLVKKLGPCLPGQVVADNGACQPLTSRRPTHRRSSRQGGAGRNTRGPGFDPVFH